MTLEEPNLTPQALKLAVACQDKSLGQHIFDLTSEIPKELFMAVLGVDDEWLSSLSNKTVSGTQNELVFGLCKIWGMLLSRFEQRPDLVIDWLNRPKRPLSGRTPLSLMQTSAGCNAVTDIIERMDTGDFS